MLRKPSFLISLGAISFLLLISAGVIEKENKESVKDISTVRKPLIVFLVSEDSLNYEAHKTIPVFAKRLGEEMKCNTAVLIGAGPRGAYTFPNFDTMDKADLVVVFARRLALPHDQMSKLKNYFRAGKPLVGIRTANHAFTAWDPVKEGFEDWPEFVPSFLGCQNRGYGPVEPGVDLFMAAGAANHPVAKGLPAQWHSQANVYKVAPLLADDITVILRGKVNELDEPVAWVRKAGSSKVFYTSLGHPTDFKTPQFIRLLFNGIKWALEK